MKKTVIVAIIAVLTFTIYFCNHEEVVVTGPGIYAPKNPVQGINENLQPFKHGEFTITPVASYKIRAKVLSRARYRSGKGGKLSPVDFALGWGKMSDESVLENIKIRQSRRWYYWEPGNQAISRKEISTHSSNHHILPANKTVRDKALKVKKGEIVEMSGYLVKVDGPKGWHWYSSTSRDDTGNGACEVFWVESIDTPGLVNPEFLHLLD